MGVSVARPDLLGKVLALKCELNSSPSKYINLVTPTHSNNLQAVNLVFFETYDRFIEVLRPAVSDIHG